MDYIYITVQNLIISLQASTPPKPSTSHIKTQLSSQHALVQCLTKVPKYEPSTPSPVVHSRL